MGNLRNQKHARRARPSVLTSQPQEVDAGDQFNLRTSVRPACSPRRLDTLKQRHPTQQGAGIRLALRAAPLLEEERYLLLLALSEDLLHPLLAHRTSAGPGFAADDDPAYPVER